MQMYMERTLTDCPLATVDLTPPYALRSMRDGEADVWTRVQNVAFGPDFRKTYEQVYGRGDYDALEVLFAVCGDEIIGIAAGVVRRTSGGARYGYVDWVGVLDAHRGKRLGAALTVACLNFLATAGLRHTGLWTQENRLAAIALYEKNGFVKVPLPEGMGIGEYREQRADAGCASAGGGDCAQGEDHQQQYLDAQYKDQ